LVRADGTTRAGAFSVSRISYDGHPATLCNVRDVTDKLARKRQLRKERNIKDALRDTLMHSTTRDDLEASICRELVSAEGYEFAWVGGIDGEMLESRTWSGGDGSYLDAVTLAVGDGAEPSLRAMDEQAAVYVDDVDASPKTAWHDAALDRDYRAVAAVPMLYDGICYGVLCVYDDGADVFHNRERELLTDMAEGLGYAINSLQKTTAVTSDTVVELDLRIEAPDDVLGAVTASGLPGSLTVRDTISRSDDVVVFLATDCAWSSTRRGGNDASEARRQRPPADGVRRRRQRPGCVSSQARHRRSYRGDSGGVRVRRRAVGQRTRPDGGHSTGPAAGKPRRRTSKSKRCGWPTTAATSNNPVSATPTRSPVGSASRGRRSSSISGRDNQRYSGRCSAATTETGCRRVGPYSADAGSTRPGTSLRQSE